MPLANLSASSSTMSMAGEAVCSRLPRAVLSDRMEDSAMIQPNRTELTPSSAAERAQAIRARLPGQMVEERLELARLRYGQLYPLEEIRRRVADTLPRRVGFIRGAAIEPIEAYREPIPDAVLLEYDDAVQSGLFSTFWVARPRYYEQRRPDPWVLGQVKGSEVYAVIAQWDV